MVKKKRKNIYIRIDINKRSLILTSILVLFLISIGIIIAIGENYATHGHSSAEILLPNCASGQILKKTGSGANSWTCETPLPNCASGQILKFIGTSWQCASDDAGSGGIQVSGITMGTAGPVYFALSSDYGVWKNIQFIGVNKKCFSFVYKFEEHMNPYVKSIECQYDSASGYVRGLLVKGSLPPVITLYCYYVCFN